MAGACCYLVSDVGARGLPTAPAGATPWSAVRDPGSVPGRPRGCGWDVSGSAEVLSRDSVGAGALAWLLAGGPGPPPPAAPSPELLGCQHGGVAGSFPPPSRCSWRVRRGAFSVTKFSPGSRRGSAFGVGESQQVPGSLVKTPGSSGGGGGAALTPPGPLQPGSHQQAHTAGPGGLGAACRTRPWTPTIAFPPASSPPAGMGQSRFLGSQAASCGTEGLGRLTERPHLRGLPGGGRGRF